MTARLLTFNIWFSHHEMSKRMKAIASIIESHQPHAIALQEVTDEHWNECLKHDAFKRYYWSKSPRSRYYTMIGSLLPFKGAPQREAFEATVMDRDLLAAHVLLGSDLPPLVFGTSHLESLHFAQARKQQMEDGLKSLDVLARKKNVVDLVFCGDTNINEAYDGIVELPPPWADAWASLRQADVDPGFTFDVTKNAMMARMDEWARENNAQLRFDRFWTRLQNYELEAIELVGTQPLTGETVPNTVWPSDHFGVLLSLRSLGVASRRSSCLRSDRSSDGCLVL